MGGARSHCVAHEQPSQRFAGLGRLIAAVRSSAIRTPLRSYWCRLSLRAQVGLLLVLGLAVRLALGLPVLWVTRSDEIGQLLEPAWYLVFGVGRLPWEYVTGLRSPLLAGIVAVPLRIVSWFGTDAPDVVLPMLDGWLALLSLVLPLAGFVWCRRMFGALFAWPMLLFLLFWPPIVVLSTHALAEQLGLFALFAALAVCARQASAMRAFCAGCLLGLTAVLRLPYVPLLLLVPWAAGCPVRPSSRLALGLGAVTIFGAGALLDWFVWGELGRSVRLQWVFATSGGSPESWDVMNDGPWFVTFHQLLRLTAGLAPLALLALVAPRRAAPVLALLAVVVMTHLLSVSKVLSYLLVAPPLVFLSVWLALARLEPAAPLVLVSHTPARTLSWMLAGCASGWFALLPWTSTWAFWGAVPVAVPPPKVVLVPLGIVVLALVSWWCAKRPPGLPSRAVLCALVFAGTLSVSAGIPNPFLTQNCFFPSSDWLGRHPVRDGLRALARLSDGAVTGVHAPVRWCAGYADLRHAVALTSLDRDTLLLSPPPWLSHAFVDDSVDSVPGLRETGQRFGPLRLLSRPAEGAGVCAAPLPHATALSDVKMLRTVAGYGIGLSPRPWPTLRPRRGACTPFSVP